MNREFRILIESIRDCQICAEHLSDTPNPIFQLNQTASILIAGQAPGRRVHESGIPFCDPSGDRLRDWMGISKNIFYDPGKIAILPMGFCYPGQGKSGDLPPRKECAQAWRKQVLDQMPAVKLILVIGNYAIKWHIGKSAKQNLTETVRAWKFYESYAPEIIPLPHPSPRNNPWLRKNLWFEKEVLSNMQKKIQSYLE